MAENKTKPTTVSPTDFLEQVENEQRRKDGQELMALLGAITQEPPTMWGSSIIGFGKYHYKYASGHEGDNMIAGFSPRKQHLVLYLGPGLENTALLARLGKHKATKGCLYVNKLADVDRDVLRELVAYSVAEMKRITA